MAEQRISKITRNVLVTFLDGRTIEGQVFLDLYAIRHNGEQQLGELLNDGEEFTPFKSEDGVSILNTAQILAVTTSADEEADELMRLGKNYRITITTLHHKNLQAEVYVNLPEENSRVRDWLNQSVSFLPLFLPEKIILYINRRHIISVQD